MIVDAHAHVWDLDRADYSWLGDQHAPIDRSIGFGELRPRLAAAGVDGVVLVQAADDDRDTDAMLEVAAAHPEVLGVVAHIALHRPEEAAARLETLRADPRVVGIRTLIHDRPDPDWVLRPDVDEGLGLVEASGLPFDFVAVLPRHLELVPELVARHPRLRIVIDHLGKPPIAAPGVWAPGEWQTLIARAAEAPTVFAKVSGLYAAGDDPAAWTPDDVRPFVEHAVRCFGADRLMAGGDWPVSILAGDYARVWGAVTAIAAELLGPRDRAALFSGTAVSVYGLRDDPA